MNRTITDIQAFYERPKLIQNIDQFFNGHSYTYFSLPKFYTSSYFSLFNPIFLHRSSYPAIFEENVIFLVRDGLFDLASFFVFSPKPPKNTKATFLFPQEFEAFIPQDWKACSFSYTYKRKQIQLLEDEHKVLLYGHLSVDGISPGEVKHSFDYLQSYEHAEHLALLDVGFPEYAIHLYQFKTSSLDLYRNFFSGIPKKCRFLDERHLLNLSIDHNWTLIDLCPDPFLIYDKWASRKFLSQGGKPHKEKDLKLPKKHLSVEITPYENLIISPWKIHKSPHFDEIFLNHRLVHMEKWEFLRSFRDLIKKLYNQ